MHIAERLTYAQNSQIRTRLEFHVAILFSMLNLSVLNNNKKYINMKAGRRYSRKAFTFSIYSALKCLSNVWSFQNYCSLFFFSMLLPLGICGLWEQSLNVWNRMLPLTNRHIIKRDGKVQPGSSLSASCSCWTLMVLDSSQQGSAHTSQGTVVKVNWKIN